MGHLCKITNFQRQSFVTDLTLDAIPGATLSIYPGLGLAKRDKNTKGRLLEMVFWS